MQRQMPGLPWQVRQTALEIDLALLRKNYLRLAARARGADMLALLKCNAYGHSLREVALALESLPPSARLHGYGVANVEEGIELRRFGVKRPIYVLSGVQYYDAELHRCLATVNLTPVVSSLGVLKQMAKLLARAKKPQALHLKFNSGMNRLGIDIHQTEECLRILRAAPALRVEGLLSHFAAGENPSSPLTRAQVKNFRGIVARFRAEGFSLRYVHMANSSGLASKLFPEGNLARIGLHLYGLDDESLSPVARWTAQVYQVRELARGDLVGYGARYRARKKMRMAVLGIGYGDGYRRILSNRAEVLIRGRRCPVIGSISMDLTAVDVSRVPKVRPRDQAILIGRSGREEITAAELAEHGESISWEVLTGVSPRVPRIFRHG